MVTGNVVTDLPGFSPDAALLAQYGLLMYQGGITGPCVRFRQQHLERQRLLAARHETPSLSTKLFRGRR
jgi:hypothetical protein